jgi:hypothetical protein
MSKLNSALFCALLISSALAPTGANAGTIEEFFINDTGKPKTDFHFTAVVKGTTYNPPTSTQWGAGTAVLDDDAPGPATFDVTYAGAPIAPGGRLEFPGLSSLERESNTLHIFSDFYWTPTVPLPSALPLFSTAIAGLAAISWSIARRKLA